MNVVRAAVDVQAPPEEVWHVVADPGNLPRWDRHVAGVEDAPAGGLKVGSTYTAVLRLMGVRARVRAEVLELDPPRFARVRASGPLIEATVTTRIEPLGDDRSRLQHKAEYRLVGGPLGELAARAIRFLGGPTYVLRRGTLAQKRQAEGGWS